MAFTNEQLAILIEERTIALAEKIDGVSDKLKEVNGTVRKHGEDIVALKVKAAKSEKKWDLLWLAIASPILGAIISAVVSLVTK